MDTHTVFHNPPVFQRYEALIDVGGNVRMNMQVELADAYLVDQAVNLALQLVRKQDRRLDFALAKAGGAGFFYVDIHSRTDTLTRNLHQSELRQRQDVVARSVFLHVLTHAFIEHLTVFGKTHVNEVDDDDATHIAQS